MQICFSFILFSLGVLLYKKQGGLLNIGNAFYNRPEKNSKPTSTPSNNSEPQQNFFEKLPISPKVWDILLWIIFGILGLWGFLLLITGSILSAILTLLLAFLLSPLRKKLFEKLGINLKLKQLATTSGLLFLGSCGTFLGSATSEDVIPIETEATYEEESLEMLTDEVASLIAEEYNTETANEESTDSVIETTTFEEESITDSITEPEPQPAPEPESQPAPEPEPQPAPSTPSTRKEDSSVTVPDSAQEGTIMVWIPINGGTKYHSKSTCSKMENPMHVSIDQAKENGFTACGRCY